jgi:hypothetical protein
MGISAIGQGITVTAVRHGVATAMAFLALFYWLYGPPLTDRMADAAHDKCNEMTGSSYRNYRLEWRTTDYHGINQPQWVCYDLTEAGQPSTSFGWWVDL